MTSGSLRAPRRGFGSGPTRDRKSRTLHSRAVNALRRRLQPLTWIALVAMLALALLPTLSHALVHARGGPGGWAEVCTPQGMRLVALDAADDAGVPAASPGSMEHCPYCAHAAGDAFMPAPAAPSADIRLPADTVPSLFLHAGRTLFAWASAFPRGPPQVS